MNYTELIAPEGSSDIGTQAFQPLHCIIPAYARKFDVECFEMFRKLPTFTFYGYKLNHAANITFLAIFSLSLLGFLGVAVYARRRGQRGRGVGGRGGHHTTVFTVFMCLGALCEMAGYAARTKSYRNRGAEAPFLTQIVCLTVGPAFTAAGVYLCLRRIVEVFGAAGSLVPPRWYTRGFIGCDVAALALQGIGGGLASGAMRAGRNKQPGTRVMVAGMVFQVVTLFVFVAVASHFACTTWRRHRAAAAAADAARGLPVVDDIDVGRETRRLRRSRRFRGFLVVLGLSTLCLLWRCIFRVGELSQGWNGPLMKRQDLFIAFEGAMVAVAMLGLNVFHPALCMSLGPASRDVDSEEAAKA